MSTETSAAAADELTLEFVEKIQQFLSHQAESDKLSEAARESLAVATDCVEQAFGIRRKPASDELFNIYKLYKQQRPDQRQTLSSSSSSSLDAESFKNQGNDYMKQDKFKEAYDCYTKAINIDSKNAIYYSNRAAASSKSGDYDAAITDCLRAVVIDPTYSKAYGRMGLAYASLNDNRRAKESYTKALELDPDNESYKNNLRIAEEKLANPDSTAPEGSIPGMPGGLAGLAGLLGGLGGGAAAGGAGANAGAGGADMMSMLRSMMNNPEVMQMAMRGLQDPRMQNLLFGGLSGAAAAATGGGGAAPGSGGAPPAGSQNDQPGSNNNNQSTPPSN